MVAAVAFVWLGMALAISFLEVPLKFRAPGVTMPIGLGIGRIVFRALKLVETVLAAIRPVLNRRSDRVLAGHTRPRSRAHLAHVGLEAVKVVALTVLGVVALAAM